MNVFRITETSVTRVVILLISSYIITCQRLGSSEGGAAVRIWGWAAKQSILIEYQNTAHISRMQRHHQSDLLTRACVLKTTDPLILQCLENLLILDIYGTSGTFTHLLLLFYFLSKPKYPRSTKSRGDIPGRLMGEIVCKNAGVSKMPFACMH